MQWIQHRPKQLVLKHLLASPQMQLKRKQQAHKCRLHRVHKLTLLKVKQRVQWLHRHKQLVLLLMQRRHKRLVLKHLLASPQMQVKVKQQVHKCRLHKVHKLTLLKVKQLAQ